MVSLKTDSPTPPRRRAAEKIRDTARDLFYSHGIRAVGVDEIVRNAGVTKPSLYRAYGSKDDLAAAYLCDYQEEFWRRFEATADRHPHNVRAQIMAYFTGLADRASQADYRGCGLTNAVVEYPDQAHPVRQVAGRLKEEVRQRLTVMSRAMNARDPALLADGLLLLMEGTFIAAQIFGPGGPAGNVALLARQIIDANCPPDGA
ncbi:TetR/AcrR family transcriptional regulator [Gluconacetobacter azotocaptans]|uniref:TetR/AcrR family transcriptional regulator n=1 Tax=Gluconacetobacter azotocaptans TaxID=142834 RepID=A0A7W4JPM8_9PROT|nr:TetR/AcrR family transcriptional regulator [Gluconacetobacter azotocaptans]